MRKFNAREAPPVPNTFSKNKLATPISESRISCFDATVKYAMLARMYRVAVRVSERGALHLRVLTGSYRLVSCKSEVEIEMSCVL